MQRLVAIGALVLLGGAATTTTASPPGRVAPPSVTLTESALEGVHGTAPDATVRNDLTVTAAGTRLRVRLSNPFGGSPVDVRSVWIGLQPSPSSPALVPGSDHRATFAGGGRLVELRLIEKPEDAGRPRETRQREAMCPRRSP